ncbi:MULTISPECIES: hypothetical protein [Mesorhizobium]|uniref:hypothetical protein n=1 Tax=Mesorhizobium TaxID=68287 RepID=UPI0007A9512E|nr:MULTISPECIES: hypothetical protein [Mesorhizobium]AMX93687.1 hypothetical protein A4R28_11545 [Mesorhizobium ciceri]MDF3208383.1 hypothetical protein [Mesorhizobium sp. LMG15046]MDF3229046.1 hypothetical protein [Mesorhizobium sp. DSM 30133]RUU22160.1 hypothetical protein EOC84_03350 [Mesorhizobium sp. Primo-B]RUU37930.1 hypothetical protein EOC83_16865 [Mesorhizobium sp. Primo-A]
MPKFTVQPCQADQGATYVIADESGDIVLRTWSNSKEEIEIAERAAAALSGTDIAGEIPALRKCLMAMERANLSEAHRLRGVIERLSGGPVT